MDVYLNIFSCQSPRAFKSGFGSQICFDKAKVPGTKIVSLRYLATVVYQCINGTIPKYPDNSIITKERKYELPYLSIIDSDWVQTTDHDQKTFKDYVEKIWNSLPNYLKSAKYLIVLIKY